MGKNHALRTLLKEASGTYVLYLDVDTVLSVYSISQLVSYAETTRADMISVLPQRSDVWRASVLLAPLRYFWHVLFHRAARPVVASSAWMVRRKDLLHDFEDFSQLKDDVEPEVTIAQRYLAKNSYKFLTSHQLLGVSYEKDELPDRDDYSIALSSAAFFYAARYPGGLLQSNDCPDSACCLRGLGIYSARTTDLSGWSCLLS